MNIILTDYHYAHYIVLGPSGILVSYVQIVTL